MTATEQDHGAPAAAAAALPPLPSPPVESLGSCRHPHYGNSNEDGTTVPLPRVAHPTAQAFFDALDGRRNSKGRQTEDRPKHHPPVTTARVLRASLSLGWRNRHSQSDFYPISVSSTERAERDSDSSLSCEVRHSFTVRQVQRGEVEGTYGTGATVWPAAIVLVRYLERHPHLVRGRRVVDLGSGTGITSVAAAVLGAASVVCTDGEEAVVRLGQANVRRAAAEIGRDAASSVADDPGPPLGDTAGTADDDDDDDDVAATTIVAGCPVRVETYWWGTDTPPDDRCTVVLVADCVLPKLYPIAPLVQAIDECLPRPSSGDVLDGIGVDGVNGTGTTGAAILSYEHRYYPDYDPRDRFRELAHERGLQVHNVPAEEMDPIYSVDDIEIWIVTRGGANGSRE